MKKTLVMFIIDAAKTLDSASRKAISEACKEYLQTEDEDCLIETAGKYILNLKEELKNA